MSLTESNTGGTATADATKLQTRIGAARGDSRAKTIKVEIGRLMLHRKDSKYLRRRTFVQVHDPENKAHVGDQVEIVPCRRISKTKSWRLLRIVRADAAAPTVPTGL